MRYGLIWVMVFSWFTAGCGYDKFTDTESGTGSFLVPNADIASVRRMSGEGINTVRDSIIVAGYVSANDKSGNIYRSFFIEDGTGALEVRAGMYSLHNVYVRGRYVAVKLCGMNLSLYNGTLQAGLSVNENGYGVGYIDNWAIAGDYLLPGGEFSRVAAQVLTAAELTTDHCGSLVTVAAVTPVPGEEADEDFPISDMTWALPRSEDNPVPQAAYRFFEDREGDRIVVYTSGYASFAGSTVPAGRVSLTGILGYGAQGFYLTLRDLDDVVPEKFN